MFFTLRECLSAAPSSSKRIDKLSWPTILVVIPTGAEDLSRYWFTPPILTPCSDSSVSELNRIYFSGSKLQGGNENECSQVYLCDRSFGFTDSKFAVWHQAASNQQPNAVSNRGWHPAPAPDAAIRGHRFLRVESIICGGDLRLEGRFL